jgi:hypothetical protein
MAKAKSLSLFIALLATWQPILLAEEQGEVEVAEGSRTRVVAGTGRKASFSGTLVALDSRQLTIQIKGTLAPVAIDRDQVMKLDVSAGRGKRKAATIGALVGVTLAGAFSLMNAGGSDDPLCSGSGCATLFVVLGVPAAATGALVGALAAPERWHEAPLSVPSKSAPTISGHVGIGVVPVRGGGASIVIAYGF